MTSPVYFTTMTMFLGTVLLVAAMIAYAIVHRGRAAQARSDAYRQLADRAVSAEAANASVLGAIQHDLSDLRARMAAVETVLKDVG